MVTHVLGPVAASDARALKAAKRTGHPEEQGRRLVPRGEMPQSKMPAWGWRHTQNLRGPREIALLGDNQKVAQAPNINHSRRVSYTEPNDVSPFGRGERCFGAPDRIQERAVSSAPPATVETAQRSKQDKGELSPLGRWREASRGSSGWLA